MRGEFSATREQLRAEIKAGDDGIRHEMHALHESMIARFEQTDATIIAGDEETRRYMRVLYEDLVSRITTLQEGRRSRKNKS
jgi:hypothetical protein